VDAEETLAPIVSELVSASEKLPVVFVAHPRTIKSLERFGLTERLEGAAGVKLLEPLPYIQFMNIVTGARRLRRAAGRDHLSRHPLPDATREHRAPGDRHGRHE
jgi:UDP-N-acetylglucosamine 2-epimerase (non-hydrolysing)